VLAATARERFSRRGAGKNRSQSEERTGMRERARDTVEAARPYLERAREDKELQDHVKNAYASARRVYEELLAPAGATGIAMRVARDKDLRDELQNIVEELREAGKHARGEESHTARNVTLLTIGIALGVLFNPMTGPDTRRWLKEKIFGPEEFEYGGSASPSGTGSTGTGTNASSSPAS
jgi:hypothetical protein